MDEDRASFDTRLAEYAHRHLNQPHWVLDRAFHELARPPHVEGNIWTYLDEKIIPVRQLAPESIKTDNPYDLGRFIHHWTSLHTLILLNPQYKCAPECQEQLLVLIPPILTYLSTYVPSPGFLTCFAHQINLEYLALDLATKNASKEDYDLCKALQPFTKLKSLRVESLFIYDLPYLPLLEKLVWQMQSSRHESLSRLTWIGRLNSLLCSVLAWSAVAFMNGVTSWNAFYPIN